MMILLLSARLMSLMCEDKLENRPESFLVQSELFIALFDNTKGCSHPMCLRKLSVIPLNYSKSYIPKSK